MWLALIKNRKIFQSNEKNIFGYFKNFSFRFQVLQFALMRILVEFYESIWWWVCEPFFFSIFQLFLIFLAPFFPSIFYFVFEDDYFIINQPGKSPQQNHSEMTSKPKNMLVVQRFFLFVSLSNLLNKCEIRQQSLLCRFHPNIYYSHPKCVLHL